jgi:hypothetical protein
MQKTLISAAGGKDSKIDLYNGTIYLTPYVRLSVGTDNTSQNPPGVFFAVDILNSDRTNGRRYFMGSTYYSDVGKVRTKVLSEEELW